MSNNHYILTVPVEYKDNGTTKTTFRRVGVIFENARKGTGEIILNIKCLTSALMGPNRAI